MSEKRSLIEQMLEHLVNDEQQKAEELFHEYVVRQSREIYENLIESEMTDDDEDDEDVEEGFDDEETFEADDEMDLDSEDPTDDLAGDVGPEMDDMGDDDNDGDDVEELFQDLDAIVDELQAKFDAQKSDDDMDDIGDDDMDDMGDDDMDDMGDDKPMKDDFELKTVREYVEKVPTGHGAEKKGAAEKVDNKRSTIDNMKNDMGGTTANILSGRNGADSGEANKGQLKGSGLLKGSTQDMKTGNINVPGGNAGKTSFKKKEPGHGPEKKGASESADSTSSLFRGRR
jgi:hypothetical protein